MLEASQPWNLFGYDLRQAYYWFRGGWSDFLWGRESPVLPLVDEIVALYPEDGEVMYYRADKPAPGPSGESDFPACRAVLLPDRLILPRTLEIPVAAEGSLPAVVAMEVRSRSPFPADDTCAGWRLVSRDEEHLQVQLVISSSSAVMEYIGELFDCHDRHEYEVWAEVADDKVVIEGFGEADRKVRSRGRLVRAGLGVGYCVLALVLCFALATGFKYLELQRVEAVHQSVRAEADSAVNKRAALSSGKELVAAAAEMIAQSPDPHLELGRLSRLLDDETWLAQLDIRAAGVRIDGQSPNAAEVMQFLGDQPEYGRVTAPVAIRKVSRGDMERFVLELQAADLGGTE